MGGEWHYRRARAVGQYRGMLRDALHLFKYRLQRRLANTLGVIMTERLPALAAAWQYDFIMPVPLHPRRLRSRGFNQALCLAAALAGEVRVPLDRFNLRRVRWTASQVGLTVRERAANVRDAFAVSRPEALRGKCVLLIDDIYTSGSTVNECSRVLIGAGAEAVDVLTLARVA
jgi:ComF family protein